jgi:hypothetical protein
MAKGKAGELVATTRQKRCGASAATGKLSILSIAE